MAENDVILPATRAILESVGGLTGKVVIDAMNPLMPMLAGLEYGTATSGAEGAGGEGV